MPLVPDKSLPLVDPRTGRASLEWYTSFQNMARIANVVPSRSPTGTRQLLVPTSDLPLIDKETGRITLEWYRFFHSQVRAAADIDENDIETRIHGVTMIPAAGEFAYHTTEVRVDGGAGSSYAENRHTYLAASDWDLSLTEMAAALPNLQAVSLFVAWFGSDLRCDQCEIKPKVDTRDKGTGTFPISWTVAGLTRATADVVTQETTSGFGRPAYGGTPTDQSLIAAIQDLKARGYAVNYTPFLVMDIAASNGLTDPYTGAADQPAYPWRGRITCDPAPGTMGTPDKTAAATAQVDTFYGSVTAADFTIGVGSFTYSGPATEWSYSRFVLYQAATCAAAGGVDAFMIGSEMRGIGWVRDSATNHPFVAHLQTLAAEVSTLLPSALIVYAADWSEFFGYQPPDGTGDVIFHLDPLWSDANLDVIGIDNYWPLSDWRDGTDHLDYAITHDPYDFDYLRGNMQGGEGFDYFYGSDADRTSQTRTPITDGGYGKPWVFQYKNVKDWWLNQHYNRPGGVEDASPTGWVPESKPVWMTEVGCPAIDKGPNQPNVFVDVKSSESFFPYFSSGQRDDLAQRRHLRAFLSWFDPDDETFEDANNPVSGVYGERMVNHLRTMVYTWDARPFPHFPSFTSIWSDGFNWKLGHWIIGRVSPVAMSQFYPDFIQVDEVNPDLPPIFA